MPATLTSISPPRDRAGEPITLTGAGYAALGNTVTVDGLAATVTAESTTSITVTVPSGIRTDRFVPVVVTSGVDASTSTRQWWSKATREQLRAFQLAFQSPGPLEDWGAASSTEHKTEVEAKDIELLAEVALVLQRDRLLATGDMIGHDGSAPATVPNGPIGSTVVLDRAGGTGVNHRIRRPGVLTWGRQVSNATATLMPANGQANAGTVLGTQQGPPDEGVGVRFAIYVDLQGGTRKLDQVRVLRNGVEVYDSGAGLALDAQQFHTANLADVLADVLASDRFEVEMTGDAGTSTLNCLAFLGFL